MIPFTFNDIEVGARLVQALARQASTLRGMPITYGDLLTLARSLHPKDEVLGRAVVVGIGNKLLFVEAFCAMHGYPNLACLAVNRETMRPGPGYQGDWEADKRAGECDLRERQETGGQHEENHQDDMLKQAHGTSDRKTRASARR